MKPLDTKRRRVATGEDVFSSSIARLEELYSSGDRIMVGMSGGKDSTVSLELARIAAANVGYGPVECVFLDDEIQLPGTSEYVMRLTEQPDLKVHWHTMPARAERNVFNRENPYWWAFDDRLDPSQWVREPPEFHVKRTETSSLYALTNPVAFPPPEGRGLWTVLGMRANESRNRAMGLASMGTWKGGKPDAAGSMMAWPIYDWEEGDIWRAMHEHGWDYNSAYDHMLRHGLTARQMRIAPPTMRDDSVRYLEIAYKAWPQWFDKVCERLPGVRLAAHYGIEAIRPHRRPGELWSECFQRTCIDEAPAWIAERAELARERQVKMHARHASSSLSETSPCPYCNTDGTWRSLAYDLFNGDPWDLKGRFGGRGWVHPEFFRPGAGYYSEKP